MCVKSTSNFQRTFTKHKGELKNLQPFFKRELDKTHTEMRGRSLQTQLFIEIPVIVVKKVKKKLFFIASLHTKPKNMVVPGFFKWQFFLIPLK